jgi:3-oxoacyl-[acyl-carrier-protein] synthase-3
MGTTLEAAVTSTRRLRRSSLRLADRAARRCLTRGGHASSELDMLLNAGLYREDGLGEPALAALIQEDIGANPRQPPAAGHGTFSLDIANGACGVLTAVYLLDGFMRSQVIHLGMVVTSDVAPSGARGYGFPSVGGALLLGWDDATPGFTAFQFETFPEYAGLFESRAHWEQKGEHAFPTRRRGRNRLVVTESPDYGDRCVDCAVTAVHRFLDRERLTTGDLDLVATNAPAPGFGDALAGQLGVPSHQRAHPRRAVRQAHTAGLPAALDAAQASGQLEAAHTALFVTAGAGITIALALYRQ